MIEVEQLTKRYGSKTAVDDVTFRVEPGVVTGFLGPNGAGKSTTMRMIVGLDKPTAGQVRVNGHAYANSSAPLHEVGILLEAKAVHKGRSARAHLRSLADTHSIPYRRVEEVIEMTGLQDVAKKRVGGFSLGMGQRLGIAAALLAEPQVLVLDEPVNGLDPEGVRWVRQMVRYYASTGKTVFISSHLMSEMAQTADHVVVLGRGKVLADCPISELTASASAPTVRISTDRPGDLARLLAGPQVSITNPGSGLLEVVGMDPHQIGRRAADAGIALYELTTASASLEDAYLRLTEDAVEFRTDVAHSPMGA